ncbi:MAG: nickel insertion protein, partial [Candidatus Sulfotelmatobacter sp.]
MVPYDEKSVSISMRVAYLECFSGMSGDMFLGALVDAGVAPRLLEETVAALGIGARLEVSRVVRSGISATKVDVYIDGEKDLPREQYWERQTTAHNEHEHRHGHHEHDHHEGKHSHQDAESRASRPLPHEHSVSHEHPHSHAHGRGLTEIREIISAAAISETARKTALAIFEALGRAEAKIH